MNVRLMVLSKQTNSAGETPIYVEVNYRDKNKRLHTLRIPTGERVKPQYWSKKQQVTKGYGKGFSTLNEKIGLKKSEVLEYIRLNPTSSLTQIKEYFSDKQPERISNNLVAAFQEFLAEHAKRFPNTSTRKAYTTVANNLSEFASKFSLQDVGYKLFERYHNWLKKEGRNPETIKARLKKLRVFTNYLADNNLITDTTYKKYSIGSFNAKDVLYLTIEEVNQLYELDLSKNKQLDRIRDLLIFTCFTALRFSDSHMIRPHHIKDGQIQNFYTQKTDVEVSSIPVIGFAKPILEKYSYNLSALKLTNQHYNRELKKLGELAGITSKVTIAKDVNGKRVYKAVPKSEIISSHIGRKTFVTLAMEAEIPVEVIKKVTGHKDNRSFEAYLKITNKLKQRQLKKLEEQFPVLKVV